MEQTISLMLDCSRNAVPNIQFLKDFIIILKKCGYNQLQLYTEDTYKIDGEPFFGYFRGAYSKEELKELDDFAYQNGVELVPAIQVLGHLASIFKWGEYKPMHDEGDCLLVGEEKTYELIDKMIAQVSSTFRTKKINIGMDESFSSGKGEYLKRHGYRNPNDIFFEHLGKVAEILKKYDREAMMWGDMFYRNMNNGEYYSKTPIVSEKASKLIPENIDIIYWDYYTKDKEIINAMAKSALNLKAGAYFAGGVWSWVGFIPRCDFAIKQTIAAVPTVKAAGINKFINTLWGDNGGECSKVACLPAIFYFAELAKGIENEDIIKDDFKKAFGLDLDVVISLKDINDLDNDNDSVHNVCKYMLFNDLIAGIYDNTVDMNKTKKFTAAKEKYGQYVNDELFGYVFKTAQSLASALELKYDLGVRIRKAYKAKNKEDLKKIVEEIPEVISRIENFYEDFKNQWYKENKYEGFEIQTLRIGGLILRCKEVKALLESYINGEIKNISTLDQDILPFNGCKEGGDIWNNSHLTCASINTH